MPGVVASAAEKPGLTREFCAENFERVPAAIAAGAARIELCDNLAVGGTTPSLGVIRATVAYAHAHGARVMCMVRPRGGNFEYTDAEADIMACDLLAAKREGVDGVVFGCTRDGQLDRALIERLVGLAHEDQPQGPGRVDVTFHMAFDALDADAQLAAIDWLAEQGVERILTHGGPGDTPLADNLPRIAEYVARAAGRLVVLPGGGVTWENAEAVAAGLGVSEVHGTKIVRMA